jgi:hypothetical protein
MQVGSVAIHSIENRKIFSLVTKNVYYEKTKEEDFIKSLIALRDICRRDGIRYLAMCKLGSGRSGLNWDEFVSLLIKNTFKMMEVEIHFYHIDK